MAYTPRVIATLLLMILTGAARTIVVKVFFQLGFDDPFLVAILLLMSHSLAIPLYFILKLRVDKKETDEEDSEDDINFTCTNPKQKQLSSTVKTETVTLDDESVFDDETLIGSSVGQSGYMNKPKKKQWVSFNGFSSTMSPASDIHNSTSSTFHRRHSFNGSGNHISSVIKNKRLFDALVNTDWKTMNTLFQDFEDEDKLDEGSDEVQTEQLPQAGRKMNRRNRGSTSTGLSQASKDAVQWVHRIPFWAKPLMSSLFCLLDMVFRMLTILYLAASVAQLLMGGLDLVFSVLAARAVRKRHVTRERWAGSGVMVIGLVIVALSEMFKGENETSKSLALGIVFVLLRVIMGMAKDLTQELFMQESTFPASLLLGMEGLYALLIYPFTSWLGLFVVLIRWHLSRKLENLPKASDTLY